MADITVTPQCPGGACRKTEYKTELIDYSWDSVGDSCSDLTEDDIVGALTPAPDEQKCLDPCKCFYSTPSPDFPPFPNPSTPTEVSITIEKKDGDKACKYEVTAKYQMISRVTLGQCDQGHHHHHHKKHTHTKP